MEANPTGERGPATEAGQVVQKKTSKAIGLLKKKPALGVMIAGGLGFVAANVIGVGEMAIAMAAGYAAYRALTS